VYGVELVEAAEKFASCFKLHNFTCSSGWLCWFGQRHNITTRELCGGVECVEPLSGLPENTQASRR
jgi:hypothetical protein